jgi:serine/threonine protein kinase
MTDDAYESEPWFMGSMTREDAEQYLNTHATVTSLVVRNSSQPGALCLSVRLKSGVFTHTYISRVHAGWTMLGQDGRGVQVEGLVARSVRELLEVTGILTESSFVPLRRESTLFSADAPQAESTQRAETAPRPTAQRETAPRDSFPRQRIPQSASRDSASQESALGEKITAGGGSALRVAQSASLKLALVWGLAQLACFYTDASEENNLAPLSYLIRTSTTNSDSLVLTVRSVVSNELVRVLVRRIGDNLWQAGVDEPVVGTFADLARKILPPHSVPHNDPMRAQQQRLQSMRRATAVESLEQRVHNHSLRSSAPVADNILLVRNDGGDRASVRERGGDGVVFGGSIGGSVRGRDGVVDSRGGGGGTVGSADGRIATGNKSKTYGSISAAHQAARINDETVRDGTLWTGVARTESLAALDARHNDIDGMSLAVELWYFFDVDTFGANAILAGLEVGSYLVRLNSSMTQFVVSFVREIGKQPVHVLIEVDRARRTVTTLNAPNYSSVRELVSRVVIFQTPVSRLAYAREFVDCTIALRERPLGVGVGGVVLRGRLNGSIDVAVKRLLATSDGSDDRRLAEAEAMLKVPPHSNVNRLYGLVLKPLALVIEFCDRGSLDKLLGIDSGGGDGIDRVGGGGGGRGSDVFGSSGAQAVVLSTSEIWQLALGIARGVAHLHQARIVHRDLATRNILVSTLFIPKVSDFGMSRLLDDDETAGMTEELRGPIKWQAPEQLRGARRAYSFKSDVFSFAVLLTEIVNRRLPWHNYSNRSAAIEVVSGARTEVDSHCAPALRCIIQQCWAIAPDDRPTMVDVCAMLDRPMPVVYDEVDVAPAKRVVNLYDDIGDV